MLRLVLAGSVAVLTILMAVACGGGDSPTSTVARDSSGSSEVTAVPTTVNRSPVARDGSGSSEVTVAEYVVWCGEIPSLEFTLTWGHLEESYAELIDAYEDMSAPEELKAVHDAITSLLKASHDFVRMQDASEPYDRAAANAAANDDIELMARVEALDDLREALDGETKSQLADVGCYY